MDLIVIAAAIASGLLVPRPRALALTAAAWIFSVSMVAWRPAHSSNVPSNSAGFWVPRTVLAVVAVGIVVACAALRARRDRRLAN